MTDEVCAALLPGAPTGRFLSVEATCLHAGRQFWKLGSIARIDAARDVYALGAR